MQFGQEIRIREGHDLGAMSLDLVNQKLEIAPAVRATARNCRETLSDLKGLGADGTGGSAR